MGQQERVQLSLLLVGFFVSRAVSRGPSELLETTILPKQLFPGGTMDKLMSSRISHNSYCHQHIFVHTRPTCILHEDTSYDTSSSSSSIW
jgi:hypothetical protein